MSISRKSSPLDVLTQGDGSALPPPSLLKLSIDLKLALSLVICDVVLRLVVLGYWWLGVESVPALPLFSKGVQHPMLQALQLLVEAALLLAISRHRWRTPLVFARLSALCLVASVAALVLAGVYFSFNVVGIGWGLAAVSGALKGAARKAVR